MEIELAPALPRLWGRLSQLSPSEAELVSQFRLPPGSSFGLDFEIGPGAFAGLRVRVAASAKDGDGWYVYSLSFSDPGQRELLTAALRLLPPED